MQSIALPLRLQENGLLARGDRAASVIALLQMMARTPAGSWAACPSFGLRDLFEDGRQRAEIARLTAQRINGAFADLGLSAYKVTEVMREISTGRGTDKYSITLENSAGEGTLTTIIASEQ